MGVKKIMKKVGFLISHKSGEKRRAILPSELSIINNKEYVFFEKGYGETLGIRDEEYKNKGVIVLDRDDILKCDVLVDVKLGDADYLDAIEKEKVLCGWAHCVQNIDFTSAVIKGRHTVLAWERMYEKGRYIFYRNREVAGEAAIMQAFMYCGKMPYDCKVAILGNGQTAKGALRILTALGAEVDVYGRKLEQLFIESISDYDVLVNCVLWDTSRKDRIIYREDLRRMKSGAMIIDVSCDPYLEIETSHPTTIDDPVYVVDGILHYAVDNTPAMYPITISKVLSNGFAKYVDHLVEYNTDFWKDTTEILCGDIMNLEIANFRRSRGIVD